MSKGKWTDALIIVSIFSVGVIVAGLTNSTESTEQVAVPAEESATQTTTAPPPADTSYVTPSVVFPTQIPGCPQVEAPSQASYSGFSTMGEQSYDNPKFPWFSGPKATAMSNAARAALPATVELRFASPSQSLLFQPILSPDNPSVGDMTSDLTIGDGPVPTTSAAPTSADPTPAADPDVGGDTYASGVLIRDGRVGSLSVDVQQWKDPVPPCVAGNLDRRAVNSDGTVVDTQETWTETNGVRTTTRSATAYTPDTRIYAVVNDVDSNAVGKEGTAGPTGNPPLTVDELAKLVSDPGLRTSTRVPPGTPSPSAGCSAGSSTEGPVLDRAKVESLNKMLDAWAAQHPELPVFLQPIGSLQLVEYSRNSVCEILTTADPAVKLTIAVSGGNPLPIPPDEYDPSNTEPLDTTTVMPDGSVLQLHSSFFSLGIVGAPVPTYGNSTSVTLTRPAGTQISATSDETNLTRIFPKELLQSLVELPGLDVN